MQIFIFNKVLIRRYKINKKVTTSKEAHVYKIKMNKKYTVKVLKKS